jgi:hypothetical protein
VTELVRGTEGARVLAVIIPSLIQVDPARWRASLEGFKLDPSRYDPNRPNALFRGIFERHGIAVVDLTPTFAQAILRGERIYYPIDQHLTPAGYRRLAEEVAKVLP